MLTRLEKRLSPRRNTNMSALIAFRGGQVCLECTVRNVSDTGAKLDVRGVGQVPNAFDLMVHGHEPQRCQVVWRSIREIGVNFI